MASEASDVHDRLKVPKKPYWAEKAHRGAVDAEVRADAAEARGELQAARKHAREAGRLYSVAADEFCSIWKWTASVQCALHAARCYRRGMSWKKAREEQEAADILASELPLLTPEMLARCSL